MVVIRSELHTQRGYSRKVFMRVSVASPDVIGLIVEGDLSRDRVLKVVGNLRLKTPKIRRDVLELIDGKIILGCAGRIGADKIPKPIVKATNGSAEGPFCLFQRDIRSKGLLRVERGIPYFVRPGRHVRPIGEKLLRIGRSLGIGRRPHQRVVLCYIERRTYRLTQKIVSTGEVILIREVVESIRIHFIPIVPKAHLQRETIGRSNLLKREE